MKEKVAVQQAFTKNRADYVTSTTHAQGPDLDIIIDWLQPTKQMRALDVATGGGHVAKRLAPSVEHVFATDLTKPMLENTANFLQAEKNIDFIIADAEQLPFLDEQFDLVTCRVAAHHFPRPAKFISEVERVLKSGGKFLLIDNIAPESDQADNFINKVEKMRDFSHGRIYKVSEWKEMFATTNLQFKQDQLWKKQLPFDDWVDRTIDDPEAREAIEQTLLQANTTLQQYFDIQLKDNHVTSFAIDTWNALYEK